MCNQVSDTISSHDRSFAAHRHGENHHSKPLWPQAFLMTPTPNRIRGGAARSHAGAHEGTRDPRATRARDASQATAREAWTPVRPPATPGLNPTECARRPASRRSPTRRCSSRRGSPCSRRHASVSCTKSEARESVSWGGMPSERRGRAGGAWALAVMRAPEQASAWRTC